jgi:hypothetical protein
LRQEFPVAAEHSMALYEIVTVLVIAIAMALSLAHALEAPGKMRLSREHYLAAQTIYYPGFTWGGVSEPLGFVLLAILAFLTPIATAQFWLIVGAAASLAAMQAVFWSMTQPINRRWLKDVELSRAGNAFFEVGASPAAADQDTDWTLLRDRWERSHLIRAGLGGLAFVLLITAVAT